jgi:hypothetical protein
MWIDHVVPDLVLDVGNLTGDLEVLDPLLNRRFGDDALLFGSSTPLSAEGLSGAAGAAFFQVCR